ncbi:dTDP-4-dehydrorhamnose 3,5-epimerase family protein [Actinomadura livida]|uniref:Epimerase EvaD n=1 Tax=Actinomadura livida TaxID=79909 RepID=A0A7W7MW27_9ACTN|nr:MULTISPECIES: dTDP-4-dehydrorhamnose 3,5-epimerase [Actinomadura]MBB4772399.1 epimerase EvaD [Actinomadura catellatispora]GGU23193.1 dTDP-4-dehydrorhamnose 3,5-epimerase [Actinomadura livida]
MDARELAVKGVLEFSPRVFRDDRGLLVSHYQEEALVVARGRPLFPVAQTLHTESRRGVVRGVHYTATPPGAAKYVYCSRGEALDILVDIRVGSPTFGRTVATRLDQRDFRALYIPVGVGHAFVALRDGTVMNYLLSASYVPANELALSPLDPELRLPLPDLSRPNGSGPVLSARDRAAPTLARAGAEGLLPSYDRCAEIDAELSERACARPR